jgi:hypothetical protein
LTARSFSSCRQIPAGKRLRSSLGTTDERIARRKLKKHECQQSAGDLEFPSITPVELLLGAPCEYPETARSRKAYKNDISYLRTLFGPVCQALKPTSTLNGRHGPRRPVP